MDTFFENKIKEVIQDEFEQLELPPNHFMNNARLMVESRKKTNNKPHSWWNGIFSSEFSVYHFGFTSVIIAACVVFVSQQKHSGGGLYNLHTQTATTSISTSTPLVGISPNPNHAANSSTVLTSIITFVARN